MDNLRDKIMNLPQPERIRIAIGLFESLLDTPGQEIDDRDEIEFRLKKLRDLAVANGDKAT